MSEQLKPCPFCGEAPGDVGYVFCMSKHDCPAVQIGTSVEKWNRRAPIPSAEEIAAMREVCEAARRSVDIFDEEQEKCAAHGGVGLIPKWLELESIRDLLTRLAAARAKGGA